MTRAETDEQFLRSIEIFLKLRCVLVRPPRSGSSKPNRRYAKNQTTNLMNLWLAGKYDIAWQKALEIDRKSKTKPRPKKSEKRKTPEEIQKRKLDLKNAAVSTLVDYGDPARGNKKLMSFGLCPDTPQSRKTLQDLHPERPPHLRPFIPRVTPQEAKRDREWFREATSSVPSTDANFPDFGEFPAVIDAIEEAVAGIVVEPENIKRNFKRAKRSV